MSRPEPKQEAVIQRREVTQFSRLAYEQDVAKSDGVLAEIRRGKKPLEQLTPLEKGLWLFDSEVTSPNSEINKQIGGWKNVARIRVMASPDSTIWQLDYTYALPLRTLLEKEELARKQERASKEANRRRRIAEARAAEADKKRAKKERKLKLREKRRKRALQKTGGVKPLYQLTPEAPAAPAAPAASTEAKP